MDKFKQGAAQFLSGAKFKFRKLIRRCPRPLKILAGPIIGALIGLIGGIPGFFIGLLMGYLIGRLFVQSGEDRRILDYFESPGSQQFYEGESGLAAWCALSVLVASQDIENSAGDNPPDLSVKGFRKKWETFPFDITAEKILRRTVLEASYSFTSPLADPHMMEHFSRLAWSDRDMINPDLLAESLAARRALTGDIATFARNLSRLANGKNSQALVREIQLVLEPYMGDEKQAENIAPEIKPDPWEILGLPPGTPRKEVKAHYRRLAKQFHPDELAVLTEKHREAAARAFIAIKEAYKEIVG